MYNPNSLEEERLSWRSVVYYNIVRPVRRIFEVYEAYGDLESDGESTMDGFSNTPESSQVVATDGQSERSVPSSPTDRHMHLLKLRLSPLLDTEPRLEARISGGSPVTSSGKGNLFVRSGWQARTMFKSRFQSRTSFTGQRSSLENVAPRRSEDSGMVILGEKDAVLEEIATILHACRDDIQELWGHAVVRRLREKRKLRLEEWAEL